MSSESSVSTPSPSLRVVGVGASAGGLEALGELVGHLPPLDDVTYVVAQHMSPRHASLLTNLLSPRSTLPVEDLVDGTPPASGRVYITPPNHDVVLQEGQLRLEAPSPGVGPKPSVDRLLMSLAAELGERAVALILSGTGSDGAAGVRAVTAAGGLAVVQEPRTAKYDGMPRSALLSGKIDLVLPPAEMGPTLERVFTRADDTPLPLARQGDNAFDHIYRIVQARTGFRLADYKPATVRRRIARRMGLVDLSDPMAYAQMLQADREEARRLVEATSVSVTSFFRDTEAFSALQATIEELVAKVDTGEVIRVWVPGCATGEEVYSIALLLEGAIERLEAHNVQYLIFGSDIDEEALAIARTGTYPAPLFATVPPELCDRYTVAEGDHRRIIKRVRNRVVFARQNVVEDPPFSRLHLVSCRNLLIYLVPDVQRRVLDVLHYALRDHGTLFLGKSESVDRSADQFRPIDARSRLYRQVPGAPSVVAAHASRLPMPVQAGVRLPTRSRRSFVRDKVLHRLAEHYAPPSFVLDAHDTIVHTTGNLGPFLRFPAGDVDMLVYELIDPRIRADLRAMVYRSRRREDLARGRACTYMVEGEERAFELAVSPLDPGGGPHTLVSFIEVPSIAPAPMASAGEERDNLIIGELERELQQARSHLSVVVEELETSNEELQALNEELQSTNEEFQTSNEELQSSNEELLTINDELQSKSRALEVLTADLENVKESLGFPLLVVDTDLRITHANAQVSEVIGTNAPLGGLSLRSLAWTVPVPGIEEHVVDVIEGGVPHSAVLHVTGDRFLRLSMEPYFHEPGEIEGAVLLFQDMTPHMRAERDRRESDERFRRFIDHSPAHVWIRDRTGRVLYANEAYRDLMAGTEQGGARVDWSVKAPELIQRLSEALGDHPNGFELDLGDGPADRPETLLRLHAFLLWQGPDAPQLGCVAFDVTEARRSKALQAASEARLRLALDAARAGDFTWCPEDDRLDASPAAVELVRPGASGASVQWDDWWADEPDETRESLRARLDRAARLRAPFELSWTVRAGSHDTRQLTAVGRPGPGDAASFSGIVRDTTARFQVERAGRAEEAARAESAAKDAFLAMMSHELRTPLNAILGYCGLLRSRACTHEDTEDLRRLELAGEAMLRLVNDILDLSRLEADAIELRDAPFLLARVLESVSRVAHPLVQAKGLQYSVGASPADLRVPLLGDAQRIEQVLVNLVGNAVKFTASGSVTLSVASLPPTGGAERLLRLSVSDTGQGIPPADLERVFERFTRVEGSERPGVGSGLGLAIVWQLVHRMGGEVRVQSTPGVGSTFVVELPLMLATASLARDEASASHPPPPTALLAGLHVVVVDDNALNRDVVRRQLALLGARATCFSSGAAAVADLLARPTAGEGAVDAVLMDIQMPDMSGLEATRRLRAGPLLVHLPILGLSAGATGKDEAAALASGMDAYLVKPIRPQQLGQTILDLIARKAGDGLGRWSNLPGLDGALARELMMGDWDLLRSTVDMLVAFLDDRVPRLDAASISQEDAPSVLHAAAGAAAAVGAVELERALRAGMAAFESRDAVRLADAMSEVQRARDLLGALQFQLSSG